MDYAPRLILGRFRPIDLARLLLVVLPGLPGLLFLTAGAVVDLRGRTSGDAAEDRVHAVVRARALYLAGAVTLLAGTVGMAAVVWKIARTRPEELEEPPAPSGSGEP